MPDADASNRVKALTKDNYVSWSVDFSTLARSKGSYKLLKGTETCPQDPGELMLSLSEEQRIHVKGKGDDPTAMKRPEESLSSLIARVDTLYARIKDLRPPAYTLDSLDQELACMALIRALPEEYSHFVSALMLQSTLDKDAVVQAFIQEENNRTRRSTAPVASSEAVLAVSAPSSGSAPSLDHCTCTGELLCSFCEKPHHCFHKCFALQCAKNELKAQSSSRKPGNQSGRSQRANQAQAAAPSASGTSSTAPVPPSASQAVVEYAGNASLCSSPSPTSPTCPLQLDSDADWIANTGTTSHMTPHRH
ncbi:hypothetical protein CONPUDRAFT_160671 [Coniophora puteana RWD-64-598 SS2]|uniref:DUF4219 domain-containing protein n=1 Tax=Coniophora puteana (strain RWD-64-598) TaxID=741705 RepID=R7SFH5_CONPW|nr:uncharacterized protein CONPUDRAFT_160671 [Coniophora puteana RWD-64-598 SS2]EIW73829.1 hypothetical protein CONPUDRAFT_160671 [Coniophora puteana RWD-64-598 SS2]